MFQHERQRQQRYKDHGKHCSGGSTTLHLFCVDLIAF
jgi:hypothetical protein